MASPSSTTGIAVLQPDPSRQTSALSSSRSMLVVSATLSRPSTAAGRVYPAAVPVSAAMDAAIDAMLRDDFEAEQRMLEDIETQMAAATPSRPATAAAEYHATSTSLRSPSASAELLMQAKRGESESDFYSRILQAAAQPLRHRDEPQRRRRPRCQQADDGTAAPSSRSPTSSSSSSVSSRRASSQLSSASTSLQAEESAPYAAAEEEKMEWSARHGAERRRTGSGSAGGQHTALWAAFDSDGGNAEPSSVTAADGSVGSRPVTRRSSCRSRFPPIR